MAANTVKSQTMIIHPKADESASVEPEDRAHLWTLNGEVINQVKEYKYLGIWFQEDGGWDLHADKALNKMRSAYGYWRPLLACARLPTRVRLLMLQTFVYSAVMYGAEVWDCTQAMREKMSVVVKKGVRAILGLHRMGSSGGALYGDTGLMPPGALIDAAKICWHDKCQNAVDGRWIKYALDFGYPGRRSAGRPKVGTDWTQSLKKAVRGVQIVLNIDDVSAPAAGQQPVRRMAARRNPATLVAVASQPEMDTQGGDVEGPQVAGSSVRTAVLDNLWLAGLTQMQTTYAQCPEGRPGWLPKCLLNQGRCPAEYLTLLPSPVARVITSARSGKLCAMDLIRISSLGPSVHTCIRACTVVVRSPTPWRQLCTGCCSVQPWSRTLPSSRLRTLASVLIGMRPRMPCCCPFCHQNGKISHHGRPRFCIGMRSQLFSDYRRQRVLILRMKRTTALVLKILLPTY